MNVTYLIGNGFDLGIGLKTGFKDFLKYYLTVKSDDVDISDFKDTIEKDTIELWADLELSFGKYIENFDDDDLSSYVTIYEDLLSYLNEYLKRENRKLNEIGEKNRQKIIYAINHLNVGFRPAVYENIAYVTGFFKDNIDVTFNFITFNYTNTLDRILDDISSTTNGKLYFDNRKIGEILHIHGQLDTYNMIFGVNDESQLPFSGVLPDKIKRRIIKPIKNSRVGSKKDQIGEQLIENSSIICIYGMSIGATDEIWWEKIGKWLIESSSRKLIYFVYDPAVNGKTVYGIDLILDAEDEYRNKFIRTAKISKESIEVAQKRIIVILNSDFMTLDLSTDEKDPKSSTNEMTV